MPRGVLPKDRAEDLDVVAFEGVDVAGSPSGHLVVLGVLAVLATVGWVALSARTAE